MEQLRHIRGSPSVELQHIPPDLGAVREEVDRELQEERERGEKFRKSRERGAGGRGELSR